jgi:uncharacterized membrane protein YbhN (UPF0104 family)
MQLTAVAFLLSAAAVVAIAAAYGFSAFANAWSNLNGGWLAVTLCCALLTFPAYVVSYRAVARAGDGPRVRLTLVVRLVVAGFGPFAPGGGFALDQRAFHAVEDDEDVATVRVLGLGALEWALLAPAAWASAVGLLIAGDPRPMKSLLWPWALAVPIGFAVGLWLASPARRDRIAPRNGGLWRARLRRALRGVGMLHSFVRDFSSCWTAWVGMALYWTFDILSFYAAARFIGLHLNAGEAILAYATGYALTRRSMPLGGAGVTEALMTFALHWVGQPVASALAVVVVYRVFNFVLPTIPALLVRPRVAPLLEAADVGRTPAHRERRHAAAPLGQL